MNSFIGWNEGGCGALLRCRGGSPVGVPPVTCCRCSVLCEVPTFQRGSKPNTRIRSLQKMEAAPLRESRLYISGVPAAPLLPLLPATPPRHSSSPLDLALPSPHHFFFNPSLLIFGI